MTEWAEQRICVKFDIKHEHFSAETIWVIQKPQLWTSGDWQLHHDDVPTQASHFMKSFLAKYRITQGTQPPCSLDLVPYDFWLFPKLKSSLKGTWFQTTDKIQENTMRQLMSTGRTVWGPKVPAWKRIEAFIVLRTMFLISCIFFNNCLYFSHYIAGYLPYRPYKYEGGSPKPGIYL